MASILLIDDDDVFQYSLRRACKKVPKILQFDTANNGKEAVEFLLNKLNANDPLPNYILLDLNMPVMNGFEFLDRYKVMKQELGERLASVVIAILTSSAYEKDREKALATGMVFEYVIKPVDFNETVSLIRKILP